MDEPHTLTPEQADARRRWIAGTGLGDPDALTAKKCPHGCEICARRERLIAAGVLRQDA